MKEIKFRIWDKQFNKFLYQLPEKHHLEWERFDIQQYTGLKDKNGKEIYSGDIITFVCSHCNTTEKGEIIWIEDLGCWGLRNEENENGSPLQVPFDKKFEGVGLIPIKEVIGNIYENPELLK